MRNYLDPEELWPYTVVIRDPRNNYGKALKWCLSMFENDVWYETGGEDTYIFVFLHKFDAIQFKLMGF